MLTLDRIYQANHRLRDIARRTDVIPAPKLTDRCHLYLKAENLQITGSFKVRGAYFKMSTLTEEERKRGVVACSAGNHAQGVALAAQKSGIKATIFLPATAPISKVEATRQYGAEIRLIDGIYDDAFAAAVEYQKKTQAVFIHPFDDEDVIAGQGTIGLEIEEQLRALDAVVVPVGGGGLIAGIAFVVKKLNPDCKVYGVQAQGAKSMSLSMEKGEKSFVEEISTFADGIAVKTPGELTYDICRQYVDQVVTVSDDEIASAILMLMEKEKLVAEGAGAVGVAAILGGKLPIKDKNVCAIVSGGNIDVNILSRIIGRGLIASGRLSDVTIELLDKPGQLKEVATIIADLGANVVKVHHDQGGADMDLRDCNLRISMETRDGNHLEEIKEAFKKKGYRIKENI